MRLSRIDQHIKDELCAKRRALLGVFSSRYSSRFFSVKEKLPARVGFPAEVGHNI
jgi:hypothetical protein